ncbi:MAG: HDIG domain-containing protein [Opitutales bacterium]|nr:HDIG domain-containing protein [Opitutales bacterium]NRA27628.1 HDIG domain-containing protein [Opitutales bacterium]
MRAQNKRRKRKPDADHRARLQRRRGDPSKASQFFETSRIVGGLVFIAFAAVIYFICFVGNQPRGPQIIEGQLSRTRLVSEATFTFTSDIGTQKLREEVRLKVPAVYQLTVEPLGEFSDWVADLLEGMQRLEVRLEIADTGEQTALIEAFAQSSQSSSGFSIPATSVSTLLASLSAEARSTLFDQGLEVLGDIYQQGIYRSNRPVFGEASTTIQFFNIIDDTGMTNQVNVLPFTEALFLLRQSLTPIAPSIEVSRALFTCFRTGLQQNLINDLRATEENLKVAQASVQPVEITIEEGETLIAPNQIVSAEDFERLQAHRAHKRAAADSGFSIDRYHVERLLITLGLLTCALLYLKASDPKFLNRNREVGVTCLIVAFNLLLVRVVLQLGDTDLIANSRSASAVIQYILPTTLAPILLAVLIGAPLALLSTIIISLLTAIMVGISFDVLFIGLFSGLVAIFFTTDVRRRSRLIKAGGLSGLAVAICAGFLGALNEISLAIVAQQMFFGALFGLLTGTLAIGLLPVLEQLFKFTTEITLLELTDYNHPLLRRMQVEAPGTYHHSLMVANLAERAAAEIGANPLICRACALFHDIGKLVKPEYFIENQREGINPHAEQTPSMSAIVIKAHVKEGVQLARQFKLPRILIDVIRQHHGTSLIQYFYFEALKKSRNDQSQTQLPFINEMKSVDETTFRYDGPRPRFKESAVIFFADSIEAASRSLKKVTPNAIDELIDNIFKDRLEDHQLDECPITMNEMARIKQSFSFTILNMLHSRVEYPKKEEAEEAKKDTEEQKPKKPNSKAPVPAQEASPQQA